MRIRKILALTMIFALVLTGCASKNAEVTSATNSAAGDAQAVDDEATISSEVPAGSDASSSADNTAEPDSQSDDTAPQPSVGLDPDELNNLSDCPNWGDEADFFRGVETSNGELYVDSADVGKMSLQKTGGAYALVVHCHNSFDQKLTNVVISVSYPMVVQKADEAHVSITADGFQTSRNATLSLGPQATLQLQPLAGREVVALDGKKGKVDFTADGSATIDKAFTIIKLKSMPKNADYTFFIFLQASPK